MLQVTRFWSRDYVVLGSGDRKDEAGAVVTNWVNNVALVRICHRTGETDWTELAKLIGHF